MLERYARERGYNNIRFYIDDGVSGTTFQRPGFQQMISDIQSGQVGRVIVKDMSRFGRDYLQVGMYTEVLFPENDIHFIAVNDGVDSEKGENDFTPLRNLFNEWYARDTSKKIRAVFRAKGTSGKRLSSQPVYGYVADENGDWQEDPETAPVVREIFALFLAGQGPAVIARILTARNVPPRHHPLSADWEFAGLLPGSAMQMGLPDGLLHLSTTGILRAYGELQDHKKVLQKQKGHPQQPGRTGRL